MQALTEDNYVKLSKSEHPQVGDVVLYRDARTKSILHSATVVKLERFTLSSQAVPWLLSKWDDVCGEDEHALEDVPFTEYVYEVWTDRVTGTEARP